VLGAVEIRAGDEVVELRRAKQIALLATLLLSANQVVSPTRLIDAIWGEDPPTSARALVQNYVSALRGLIEQRGHPAMILTRNPGYVIRLAPDALDVQRFELLQAQARDAAAAGDDPLAAALLRSALSQWRGPALDGLRTPVLQAAAARLDELRLVALEDRIAVDARLGPVDALAAELRELVERYPMRERLRAQLMRVLHRLGRQGEAVEVFQRGRVVLADELGVEPGPDLLAAYRAILEPDSAATQPRQSLSTSRCAPWSAPPDQLPPAPSHLVGRDPEVRMLTGALRAASRSRRAVLCAISGMAGTGKSAVALRAGNAVKDEFPDGRLFVPLNGADHTQATTRDGLAMMLRSMGVPDRDLPGSVEERAAALRTIVAGRQLLVVIDGAASEAQVRPLLAALPDCAVLVTSRRRLAALDWHVQVDLCPLAREDSERLLADLLKIVRADAGPALGSVAALCGDLPLALRAAAGRLSSRPHWTLAAFAEVLRDDARRLDELSVGDLDVRASIARSYRELHADDARALHLLGRLGRVRFHGDWLADLLRVPAAEGERLAERLVDARLLEQAADGGRGWYRLPELIRVFAGNPRPPKSQGCCARCHGSTPHRVQRVRQGSRAPRR
jgi:DNA-binding SARP family transcriptional activator